MIVDSCSFLPCDQVEECSLVGGCVQERFVAQPTRPARQTDEQAKYAHVGTKPGRTNRDPALIKRKRKAIVK